MSMSLRPDASGLAGSLQLNGVDVVTFDKNGITVGVEAAVKSLSAVVVTPANSLSILLSKCVLWFRNANQTSGTATLVGVPDLPLVVPSGATLGTASGRQAILMVLVAYNAGVPVLCIVNLAGGVELGESGFISPTTISTGATLPNVVYSASAVAAGSPYRVVGSIQITEGTAGVWASNPSLVQGQGGESFTSMQSLGFGQTWQNVLASRSFGGTFYNTTQRPIQVVCGGNMQTTSSGLTAVVDGILVGGTSVTSGFTAQVSFIVPPGSSYTVSNGSVVSAQFWSELR